MLEKINFKKIDKFLLILYFIYSSNIPLKAADTPKIEAIYFNNDNSFIIETSTKTNLLATTNYSTNLIEIPNLKLGHKIDKKLSNSNFDIEFGQNNNGHTSIKINPKNNFDYNISSRTILEGFAYEFNFEEIPPQSIDSATNKTFQEETIDSYRKAVELDPQNINVRLRLAKLTNDPKEKLENYLASLSDEALLAVGNIWFNEGYQNGDLKTMAKALISLQLAVLKNPRNPEYRFNYAQALEKFGQNSKETSRRYLEAAALAKNEYLAGNKSSESLLRNATEALIRVLVLDGDFESAAKYCTAYLNLGFTKFLNGKATLAIMKEVEASRNPFNILPNNRRAS